MSFLPAPSIIFTRQSVFRQSWLNARHVRCMTRTVQAHLSKQKMDDVPVEEPPPRSFESLGLEVPFTTALHRAFPKVKAPTDIQARLIPAILGTQDILLKDETGSGKCVNFLTLIWYLFSSVLDQVIWADTWTSQQATFGV